MALRILVLLALFGCQAETAGAISETPRLISLSPAITDTLVALGIGSQLVAVSQFCSAPDARQLPRLGGVQDLPIEAIRSLQPSLILSSDSQHGPGDKLRQAGFDVVQFSEGSLSEILLSIKKVGEAVGRGPAGKTLAARLRQELHNLKRPNPGKAKRVLLVFSGAEGPVRSVWTAGPGGWLGELLQQAGLENARSDGPAYAQIGAEGLIALAPEIIIELHGQNRDEAKPINERWSALSQIPAVRHKQLFRWHGEALLRPGPRLIELARKLAALQ
jgi:iron complex transport system substrate-binding protein